jgi:hypothetical protein
VISLVAKAAMPKSNLKKGASVKQAEFSANSTSSARLVYHAPSRNKCVQLARAICQEMQKEHGAGFDTPTIWNEFGIFLEVVANTYAKQMNKAVDNKNAGG